MIRVLYAIEANLVREARDVPFTHKGYTMISKNIRGL
jgi:hypothetical protein